MPMFQYSNEGIYTVCLQINDDKECDGFNY